MRYRLTALVGLTGLLVMPGCGDPGGPQEVAMQITVEVDWPLAREPGFVDARWRVVRLDAVPDSFAFKGTVIAEGDIGGDGIVSASFMASCIPDQPLRGPFYDIYVSGYFAAYEDPDVPESYWTCNRHVFLMDTRCDDAPQTAEVTPQLFPTRVCTPPDQWEPVEH